jgi:hypothetical protein
LAVQFAEPNYTEDFTVLISLRQRDPQFLVVSDEDYEDCSPAEFLWQAQVGLHGYNDTLVMVLKAYYDASGKEDLGRVSVAGWLSTARKWADFQTRWNEALKRAGVPFFHASSFANAQNPFDSDEWRDDERRRRELIEQLARIIRDTALFGVSSTMYYDDFETIVKLHPDIGVRYKNPYVLAARDCIKLVDVYAQNLRADGKRTAVVHIFERGDEGMGRLVDLCREMGDPIPEFHHSTPNGKEDPYVIQLQSADFAAYESFRLEPPSKAERFKPVYLEDARVELQLLADIPKQWVQYDYRQAAARALLLLIRPNDTNSRV